MIVYQEYPRNRDSATPHYKFKLKVFLNFPLIVYDVVTERNAN